MVETITDFLRTVAPLSLPLVKRIHELLVIREVPNKFKFLVPGRVSSQVYFILEGLVRGYYFDENQSERTAWIMKELDVIFAVGSFYTREPGNEYIETLERSLVASITYDELQQLYADFPEFNLVGRILTERYYYLSYRRAEELRIYNATIKWQVFVERNPELVNRVPLKYIASYLGLEKETLYRIRSGNYNTGRRPENLK